MSKLFLAKVDLFKFFSNWIFDPNQTRLKNVKQEKPHRQRRHSVHRDHFNVRKTTYIALDTDSVKRWATFATKFIFYIYIEAAVGSHSSL